MVGDLRLAIYDLRFARGFRSTLSRFAEWCATGGEKKGEMGGGLERAVAGAFSLAAHLPPVPFGGPHHSAANAVSKRNPLHPRQNFSRG